MDTAEALMLLTNSLEPLVIILPKDPHCKRFGRKRSEDLFLKQK